ncbi:MAG: hypothetical protein H6606_09440 [Flavobacteriales bacterium]|nr:hypothetical protein [Flavobacteriales bacterium]
MTKGIFQKILILSAAIFFLGAGGCKDDEEPDCECTPESKSRHQMLIEGRWQLQQGLIKPPVEVEIFGTKITISNYWELTAALSGGVVPDCQKDNLMFFQSDSTVLLDEGLQKCDPADPQTQGGGDWLLIQSDTKLKFTSFPFDPLQQERILNIDTIASSMLNLSMDYRFGSPTGDSTDHKIYLEFLNK